MKSDYEIPFSSTGDLLHYPESYLKITWQKNYEFYDELTIDRVTRGKSAAYFILVNKEQKEYPMFLSDMIEMIEQTTIQKGHIQGIFTFCKKGQNYGIRFVKEDS